MNKKQVIGAVVVCLIIVVTGLIGVRSAVYMNEAKKEAAKSAVENLESMVKESDEDIELPSEEYIGQIDIVGTIQGSDSATDSVNSQQQYSHDFYMKYVDQMIKDDNNKGIFLYVNSPGGTVYESDEMYLKLMEYKEKTGRPIYAYFADEACSGAYYISMAADKIYANRNGWTGSIGVLISLMNYEGLLKKIGVEEIDIVSGKNKTIGSGAHEMRDDQKKILQSLVDEAYGQFVDIVAKSRGLDVERTRKLADGRIYSAAQAKKYGLIDEVMGYEEAKTRIGGDLGNEKINFYAPEKDNVFNFYFSRLLGLAEGFGTKSDIQAAREMIENDESGVLMYYAK